MITEMNNDDNKTKNKRTDKRSKQTTIIQTHLHKWNRETNKNLFWFFHNHVSIIIIMRTRDINIFFFLKKTKILQKLTHWTLTTIPKRCSDREMNKFRIVLWTLSLNYKDLMSVFDNYYFFFFGFLCSLNGNFIFFVLFLSFAFSRRFYIFQYFFLPKLLFQRKNTHKICCWNTHAFTIKNCSRCIQSFKNKTAPEN